MLKYWEESNLLDKILIICGVLLGIFVIIIAMLNMFEIIKSEIHMCLLGVFMIDNGILYYNKVRKTSIMYFVIGLLIIGLYIFKMLR